MSIQELYQLYQASTGVSTDTRQIGKGQLFFALKGPNFDANKLAGQSIEQGAAYSIVDSDEGQVNDRCIRVHDTLKTLQELAAYHRDQLDIPVIGITGSNGKTTVKELLAAVLGKRFRTFATQGNLNNHIGVPLTLLSISASIQIAVVELGDNHPKEIEMLSAIAKPTHGFITNVGKDHLEGFGSMEANYQAKAELYQYLAQSGATVFLDGEDPKLDALAAGVAHQTYLHDLVKMQGSSGSLMLAYDDGDGSSHQTQLFGRFNLPNVRAAYAIGRYFQVPTEQINQALTQYTPTNNRSQLVKTDHNTILLDAYNANPSSVQLAVESMAAVQADQHKVVILGDMLELGTASDQEHRDIIDQVSSSGLQAFFCGKAYSTNQPSTPNPHMHFFAEQAPLKAYLIQHPIRHAMILLKGSRGMRMEALVDCL